MAAFFIAMSLLPRPNDYVHRVRVVTLAVKVSAIARVPVAQWMLGSPNATLLALIVYDGPTERCRESSCFDVLLDPEQPGDESQVMFLAPAKVDVTQGGADKSLLNLTDARPL